MTPAPSVEVRPGREIAHYRGVAAQDPEAILGWQSPAGRSHADRRGRLFLGRGRVLERRECVPVVRTFSGSMLIDAER
jgi:hypothetical protein